jgi:hypothetical protein
MGQLYASLPVDRSPRTKAYKITSLEERAFTMASGNGVSNFNSVKRGTLMSYVNASSDKRVRPAAKTLADGAGSSVATMSVDNAANFAVGDEVFDDGVSLSVTVTDKSGNDLILSGNATWADNSVITGGTATVEAVGILDGDEQTWDKEAIDAAGALVHRDQDCTLLTIGSAKSAECTGDVDQLKADLLINFY